MPRWRALTWVIIVFNILFLIGIISDVSYCSNPQSAAVNGCNGGLLVSEPMSRAIDLSIFLFLVIVDLILCFLWLLTRPKTRTCPVCGNDVRGTGSSAATAAMTPSGDRMASFRLFHLLRRDSRGTPERTICNPEGRSTRKTSRGRDPPLQPPSTSQRSTGAIRCEPKEIPATPAPMQVGVGFGGSGSV
jgi:hypothetical protein